MSKHMKILMATVAMSLALASTAALAGTTTYKYDALGRVVEVDYPDGSVVTYTYDKAGNRVTTVRTPGP